MPRLISINVFIRANPILLKIVTIGDRLINYAGSLFTKNIPSNEVWADGPSRFIKLIF